MVTISMKILCSVLLGLAVVRPPGVLAASSSFSKCGAQEVENHPMLCRLLERAEHDGDRLASDLHDWAWQQGLLVNPFVDVLASKEEGHLSYVPPSSDIVLEVKESSVSAYSRRRRQRRLGGGDQDGDGQLPVVFAHGMGDSCFNDGMKRIVSHTSQLLGGVYVTCIAVGQNQADDTKNGYLLNMDASVDVFTAAIQNNPHLRSGFHGIGFSQGSNLVRGYLSKVNDPVVHTVIAVNGVNAGEGAVPYCRPSEMEESVFVANNNHNNNDLSFSMCDFLMEQASRRAYTEFAQEHSFQANYWRDPRPSMAALYQKYSQLAVWNNEIPGAVNETLRENWAQTRKFVWVMAEQDGMVWPKEGEHWGAPDPSAPFQRVLPMKETAWYQQDLFGLKTADEAGKNFFESFNGDHLQFTLEDFDKWVQTHIAQQ